MTLGPGVLVCLMVGSAAILALGVLAYFGEESVVILDLGALVGSVAGTWRPVLATRVCSVVGTWHPGRTTRRCLALKGRERSALVVRRCLVLYGRVKSAHVARHRSASVDKVLLVHGARPCGGVA